MIVQRDGVEAADDTHANHHHNNSVHVSCERTARWSVEAADDTRRPPQACDEGMVLLSRLLQSERGMSVISIDLGAIPVHLMGLAGIDALCATCEGGHLKRLRHVSLRDCQYKKVQLEQ